MGAVLYPPAFAALTRWHGTDQVRALTVLGAVTVADAALSPVTYPRCGSTSST